MNGLRNKDTHRCCTEVINGIADRNRQRLLLLFFCRKYPHVSPKKALCGDLEDEATKYANRAK